MRMKIGIIGAGAMGSLYGALLSRREENRIFLLDTWKDQVEAINRYGISIEEEGDETVFKSIKAFTEAQTLADQEGAVDLAVILVKSTFTKAAVASNKVIFGKDTVALTLQNGMGNIDLIGEKIGLENVIAGTTAHGATVLGPGKIRHGGIGKTFIGELDGRNTHRLKTIKDVFQGVGIETEISTNVLGLIWEKLLVNVGINALTGITKLKNGELLVYDTITELMEDAVREGEAVARAKGIILGEGTKVMEPVEYVKAIARATETNKSSMLQDLLKGSKTEIEMINGAIVREGEVLGVATPVNRVLVKLIEFFERR